MAKPVLCPHCGGLLKKPKSEEIYDYLKSKYEREPTDQEYIEFMQNFIDNHIMR